MFLVAEAEVGLPAALGRSADQGGALLVHQHSATLGRREKGDGAQTGLVKEY